MSTGSIRERGPNTFELKYDLPRAPNAPRQSTTTTFHGSKRAARARLHELLAARDRGEHVEPSRLTIVQLVADRIGAWHAAGRISERTRESYEVALKLLAPISDVPVQRLDSAAVERWHLSLKHLSTSARRSAHGVLQRALADGVRHRICTRNAAADQGPPPAGKTTEIVMLNAEQITALLAKLEGDEWRVPVIVALYCGLRRGEQLALKWNRVDLDRARMEIVEALDEAGGEVSVKEPKTTAGRRIISLPAIVVAALREHRQQQLEIRLALGLGGKPDLMFPAPGPDDAYDSPRAFSTRWGRAAARLGVPEINWHSLRHSHASMLIAAGLPITTVAARLGHANPGVTLAVYSRLFAKDDAAAAAAIDKALGQ
jgi:integrase